MKKKSTLFLSLCTFFALTVYSGTPVIDGVISGTEGWGTAAGTGDGLVGWSNANAKKLYVTFDDNYVYFGAECNADSWHQFMFVVNTKAGGSSTDAWGRTISYDHANKPDFIFRGDIAGGNYAEYHIWDGTAWTNTGNNVNAAGTEVKGSFTAGSGFIEIRVPKATIGTVPVVDVQFIIGGNNGGPASGHGCFDAIPNDNNGTDWSAPGNFTSVSKYVSSIALPATLSSFSGELRNNTVTLNWKTLTETNLMAFDIEQSMDARNWVRAGSVKSSAAALGGSYRFTHNNMTAPFALYRLKMMHKDGSHSFSTQVTIKTSSKAAIELINNPARGIIKLAIHETKADTYAAELLGTGGKRLGTRIFQHAGGSTVFEIPVQGIAAGSYLVRVNSNSGVSRVLKLVIQ